MASKMVETYIRYGVPNDLADKLATMGLPKTTFERTSESNLKERYGLSDSEIEFVKEAITRRPIDEDIVEQLLEDSNYTCCVCKGAKSKSYIIHHIEEYSVSQNNNYNNLAVLCPDDHDLAHKQGKTLTLKLTPNQIISSKSKWIVQVREANIHRASMSGDNVSEVDYLNVPRILEVCIELYNAIPKTRYSKELLDKNLITNDGYLNDVGIKLVNKNPDEPLIFFALYGSTMLKFHYHEVFKVGLLNKLDFQDLDSLLNKTELNKGIIGRCVYYVGGLYSKKVPFKITNESDLVTFYFKRKPFVVEWLVDPKYFCSSTAKHRTSNRNVYIIYGKIRNVRIDNIDGKEQIVIDIRPYCFGLPELQKHRTPDIAYRKNFDEFFDDEDNCG